MADNPSEKHEGEYHFFVDKARYDCTEAHLTGAAIKILLPQDKRAKPLYLEGHGDPHPFLITDETRVSFEEGPKYFRTELEDKWDYFLDGEKFEVNSPSLMGAEIRKKLPEPKRMYAIYLEGLGNEPDQLINDNTCISLEKGKQYRLYTVPPATFGFQ